MSGRLSSQVVVGRQGELAEVRAAYDRAAGGSASAVLIGGEAGVGKTRLLTELTSYAHDAGARVLLGRCADLRDADMPLLPIAEAPAGAPARLPDAALEVGLTSRELEVLEHVASGQTEPRDRRRSLHQRAHGRRPRLSDPRDARRLHADRGRDGRSQAGAGAVGQVAARPADCPGVPRLRRCGRLRLAPICVVVVLMGAAPAGATPPKLLFGLGPEADGARRSELVQQSPVRMLTSWYNGPEDLAWMTRWRTTEVPRAYRAGFALHLVVWTGGPERAVATPYGEACGRAYPLSTRFLDDVRRLARTFAGAASGPPLYVTLFSEFQTYPCRDNAWMPDDATRAYYRALKDRYREALGIFHRVAPNASVSLGWGGWQARWDDPAMGGGRSLFARFADIMRASDFQSFQAMDSNGNAEDVVAMTRALGAYGPVMLAHYKPDDGSQLTFDSDVRAILTDASLRRLRALGLFALSFMDTTNLDARPATFDFVRRAAARYGASA